MRFVANNKGQPVLGADGKIILNKGVVSVTFTGIDLPAVCTPHDTISYAEPTPDGVVVGTDYFIIDCNTINDVDLQLRHDSVFFGPATPACNFSGYTWIKINNYGSGDTVCGGSYGTNCVVVYIWLLIKQSENKIVLAAFIADGSLVFYGEELICDAVSTGIANQIVTAGTAFTMPRDFEFMPATEGQLKGTYGGGGTATISFDCDTARVAPPSLCDCAAIKYCTDVWYYCFKRDISSGGVTVCADVIHWDSLSLCYESNYIYSNVDYIQEWIWIGMEGADDFTGEGCPGGFDENEEVMCCFYYIDVHDITCAETADCEEQEPPDPPDPEDLAVAEACTRCGTYCPELILVEFFNVLGQCTFAEFGRHSQGVDFSSSYTVNLTGPGLDPGAIKSCVIDSVYNSLPSDGEQVTVWSDPTMTSFGFCGEDMACETVVDYDLADITVTLGRGLAGATVYTPLLLFLRRLYDPMVPLIMCSELDGTVSGWEAFNSNYLTGLGLVGQAGTCCDYASEYTGNNELPNDDSHGPWYGGSARVSILDCPEEEDTPP